MIAVSVRQDPARDYARLVDATLAAPHHEETHEIVRDTGRAAHTGRVQRT